MAMSDNGFPKFALNLDPMGQTPAPMTRSSLPTAIPAGFQMPAIKRQPTLFGDLGAPRMDPVEYPVLRNFEQQQQQQQQPDDLAAFRALSQLILNQNVSAPQVQYNAPPVSTEGMDLLRSQLRTLERQTPEKQTWQAKADGPDISSLVKLVDAWTGSDFAATYKSPQEQEREAALNQIRMNQALNVERNQNQANILDVIKSMADVSSNTTRNMQTNAATAANVATANAANILRASDAKTDNYVKVAGLLERLASARENREARASMGKNVYDTMAKDSLNWLQESARNEVGYPDRKLLESGVMNLWMSDPTNPRYQQAAIMLDLLKQDNTGIPSAQPQANGGQQSFQGRVPGKGWPGGPQ
jgi:hypothetical protein